MESEYTQVRSRSSDQPHTSLSFTRESECQLGGSVLNKVGSCRNEILPGVGVGVQVSPGLITIASGW